MTCLAAVKAGAGFSALLACALAACACSDAAGGDPAGAVPDTTSSMRPADHSAATAGGREASAGTGAQAATGLGQPGAQDAEQAAVAGSGSETNGAAGMPEEGSEEQGAGMAGGDGDPELMVVCEAGVERSGGYGSWWRETGGTRQAFVGDNGTFTDSCDADGNLTEHLCASMPQAEGSVPNAIPVDVYTGEVTSFTVDCDGRCQQGACDFACPQVGDELLHVAVDASGRTTFTNQDSGDDYACEATHEDAFCSDSALEGSTAEVGSVLTESHFDGTVDQIEACDRTPVRISVVHFRADGGITNCQYECLTQ